MLIEYFDWLANEQGGIEADDEDDNSPNGGEEETCSKVGFGDDEWPYS